MDGYRMVFSTLAAALIVLVSIVFAHPSHAGSQYKRFDLEYGISLSIPEHWNVLSMEARKNIQATSEAVMESAEVEDMTVTKSLLAVDATPAPKGAMIRVSVMDNDVTSEEIEAASDAEIEELQAYLSSEFRKMEAVSQMRVVRMFRPRVDKIDGRSVMAISYERESLVAKGQNWLVTMYQIPFGGNRMIQFTLSHRTSDEIVWKPILEKVKRSFSF